MFRVKRVSNCIYGTTYSRLETRLVWVSLMLALTIVLKKSHEFVAVCIVTRVRTTSEFRYIAWYNAWYICHIWNGTELWNSTRDSNFILSIPDITFSSQSLL